MVKGLWKSAMVFVMLAALPALACNLLSGDEAPPVVREEQPVERSDEAPSDVAATAPSGPQDDGGSAGPAFPEIASLEDALAQFGSYRIRVDMTFESASDSSESGTLTMVTSRIVDPAATSIEMQISGEFAQDEAIADDDLTMSFYELESASYSLIPGLGCVTGVGGGEMIEQFDGDIDTDDLISRIQNPEYVGEETVNGVATYHYRFDQSNFGNDPGDLQDANGDIYVSQEYGHVVRMIMEGRGDLDDEGSDGANDTVQIEMNVFDVGQSFTIEAPVECTSLAANIPIMEGASDMTSFGGFTTYTVQASMADVVAFYEEEMGLRGYSAGSDALFTETLALVTYTADDQPDVSVNLTGSDGTVTVVITTEE
jgi:hypothetical protein